MTPVRVGIIGCGVIAPTHASAFQKLPGVQLTWACDLVEGKAHKLASDFSIPQNTTDFRRLLRASDVDLVSVCTDHASHAKIAAAALKADKHVLCEKVLAHRPAGVDAIVAAAAARPDRVCSGVFQHRFEPLNRRIRALISEGALGTMLTASVRMRCLRTDAYYASDAWRGTWAQEGGSVLINQAIHYIDALRWIMGGVAEVCGVHANRTHAAVIETEDTAAAAVVFTSGAVGTIEATCSSHNGWESALFFQGDQGAVEIFNDRLSRVDFKDTARGEQIRADLEAATSDRIEGPGKTYYGAGHPAQLADVVDAVRTGRPPYVTAASAAETADLVLGIYRSMRTGRRVTLPRRV